MRQILLLCPGRSLVDVPQNNLMYYKIILIANNNIYHFLSIHHVPDIESSIINALCRLMLETAFKGGYHYFPHR